MVVSRRRRDLDLSRVDALLARTRPGTRFDLGRPVDLDLVVACIAEAVESTPTGRADRWRWVVVDDPATRDGLAALHHGADGVDELDTLVATVPILVVPCQLGRPEAGNTSRDLATFYGAVLPAVTTFVAAAERRGLATTWTTRHLAREAEAAALLGVPPNATQVALIPVGARADTAAIDRNPEPFDPRTVSTNRWGA